MKERVVFTVAQKAEEGQVKVGNVPHRHIHLCKAHGLAGCVSPGMC